MANLENKNKKVNVKELLLGINKQKKIKQTLKFIMK